MHTHHIDEGAASVSCAALHTDGQGNIVPCPGYPHADPAGPDESGLTQCTEPEHLDPLAEARALIANDLQQRMQACAAEIEAVLAKHGMRLETTPASVVLAPAPLPEVTG